MKFIKGLVSIGVFVMMLAAMGVMTFAMENTVDVPERFQASDNPVYGAYTYTEKDVLNESHCGVIVPLKVSKPGVVEINSAQCSVEAKGYAIVYTDQECKEDSTEYYESFNVGDTAVPGYFIAKKAGTYYLKIYTYSYDVTKFTNTINLSFCVYTQTDKTIKPGVIYAMMTDSFDHALYYKYKATKTGIIVVQSGDTDTSKVVLTNAKKKEITESEYLTDNNKYAAVFTVKKGSTYYIRFSSMSRAKLNGFTVTQKAVKEKSGSKMSKAKVLKAKKTAKGTIQYGEKADWYKISVKKSKAKFTVYTENSDYLKISVYDSKGKQVGFTNTLFDGTKEFVLSRAKKGRGTYYVKIERSSKKSSGYYTLKWK